MERLEPVIEPNVKTLKNKVDVSWDALKKVEIVGKPNQTLESEKTVVTPTSQEKPLEVTPVAFTLTKEEKEAITEAILLRVEPKVKEAIKNAIELSIGNAFTRLRSDLDKTVNVAVMNEVKKEVQKIDFSEFINH